MSAAVHAADLARRDRERARELAFADWVAEARAVPILDAALARGARLRGGIEKVGPCPACGGQDRFGINTRKGLFNCRGAGRGGDVIALVQYLDGCTFLAACEALTGRPPPDGLSRIDREALARRAEERAQRRLDAERTAEQFREAERERCHRFWRAARPIAGTPAEAYLALRGVRAPAGAHLLFAPEHILWSFEDRKPVAAHRGPALLAAIVGLEGRFSGLHATWIDLDQADGKARVLDATTGELVPAKKVRGSAKAGRIELVRHPAPRRMFWGEGIETVLSVWCALQDEASPLLDGAAFWATYCLVNLAGRAVGSVPHPTIRLVDRRGRERPWRVPGPEPDRTAPAIALPETVEELFLLGDGDSDPFVTQTAIERAARRHARPGLVIRAPFAPAGCDFNDLRRGGPA